MFKLNGSKTRFFPVEVITKNDEGRERKFTFDGEFKVLNQDEVEDLIKAGSAEVVKDVTIVAAVFTGWRKVQDAGGEDLTVNDSNRELLLNEVGVRGAIVRAWMKMVGLGGQEKN